ncbi:MAG: Nmad5 family putative nucleotide modification protein [Pseudomonadota bacterium]
MKLTKVIKESIETVVVSKTFAKRNEALHAAQEKLFDQIIDTIAPDGFSEAAKKYGSWFPKVSRIEIAGAGQFDPRASHYLKLSGGPRPISANAPGFNLFRCEVDLGAKALPESINDCVKAYLKVALDLDDEEKKLGAHVRHLLASITTSKRLKAVWPEVSDFYELVEPVINLPTVADQASTINDMISDLKKAA